MRTFIFLFCTTVFSLSSGELISQNSKIVIDKDTTLTIDEVFDLIDKQTDYSFIYKSDMFEDFPLVKVKKGVIPTSKLLKKVLSKGDFDVIVDGNNKIIITDKISELRNEEQEIKITVTGIITDNAGQPLPGANILEKETSNGSQTDFDGKYTIEVTNGQAILVVSYIGFIKQEIAVNNRTNINITLQENMASLDEVVITGYGGVKRNEFVGSTSVVSAEKIKQTPMTTLEDGIQGKLAGVQTVSSSGAPGAGISVRIRGVASFAGNSEPLYVIDGVPMANDDVRGLNGLSSLNPNDIQSIEVLKDASSTAIYGSRAANGVVQITTKGGRASSSVNIKYDTFLSSQTVLNRYDLMTGDEYIDYATEFINNSTLSSTQEKQANIAELLSIVNANTDWQDEVFRTGVLQNHNLSFSGGNAKNNYFASVSTMDQEGVIIDTDFKRYSLRLNLRNEISKTFSLDSRMNFSKSENNGFLSSDGTNTRNLGKSGIGSVTLASPLVPVYDENGDFSDVAPFSFNGGDIENPIAISTATDRITVTRAQAVLALTTNFSDWLSNTSRGSIDFLTRKYDFYSPAALTQIGSQVAQLENTENYNTLFETFFTFKKELGEFNTNLVVGASLQDSRNTVLTMEGSGFPSDELENNAIQSATTSAIPQSFITERSLVGFFGRAQIDYKKKYLVSLNARRDGSSVFAANNKWANFGAIGLAWRLSEESFIKDIDFIDNLKLRYSYGSTGNQAIGAYQSLILGKTVLTGQGSGSGISVGLAPNLANQNITWETTVQSNIGLDLAMQNNKYRMSLDYYVKTTDDLLAFVNLPQSSGFGQIIDNVGKIENKGFELQLGVDIVNTDNWYFAVDGQFSINKNKVLKTKGGEDIFSDTGATNDTSETVTIVREGEPLFSFWAKNYMGNDANGYPMYEDLNNDGIIDGNDNQIVGNSLPDATYGFNTTLNYKKFSFITNWVGVAGSNVNNIVFYNLVQPRIDNNLDRRTRDFYPISDDVETFSSNRFIEDASYLRLANIKLGYQFNTDNISFIDNLNLYISGQNLITITDYSGFDPEVNSFSGSDQRQGVDLGAYPNSKTLTVGLSVGF